MNNILDQSFIPDISLIIYEYAQYQVSNKKEVIETLLDLLNYTENLADYKEDKFCPWIKTWCFDSVANDYTALIMKILRFEIGVLSNSRIKACIIYYILIAMSRNFLYTDIGKNIFSLDELISSIKNRMESQIFIFDMKDEIEIEEIARTIKTNKIDLWDFKRIKNVLQKIE